MTAVDFLLCCIGCSTMLVSGAWAVRTLSSDRPKKSPTTPARVPDEPTPVETGLNDRLAAFQTARYASPIGRPRPIEHEPTPGEPGSPRVVPQRVLQPRTRPFSVPRQPPEHPRKGPPPLPRDADVIPFPLKQKRDDTTKKD